VNYPVTVQNGTITGFQQGAFIGSSLDVTISHIVFKQIQTGVGIGSSSEIAIDNCKFNGASSGIYDGSPEGGNSYHHNTFVNCQTVLSVYGNRVTPVVLGNCHFNQAPTN
jgi:Periplasmic copper-binding protein (NosD)